MKKTIWKSILCAMLVTLTACILCIGAFAAKYDSEAIKAELPGLGCAGYVANSPHTVLGDCISAGRLYDKIGDSATAKVVYVLDNAVVCKVKIAEKEKMCGQCSE